MYRTVNETMPLTTFGTDNGRECAAGVNEPKVVHRGRLVVVASTRMGLGRLGSPRYHRINYRSYRAPRFSSGPFVVSLLFVSVPFFSALLPPLPFRLLATRGTPNSPTTVPRLLSSLDRWGRNSTRNWNFRQDRFESSRKRSLLLSFSNSTQRKGNARSLPPRYIPPLSPRRRRRPLCFATSPDVCH